MRPVRVVILCIENVTIAKNRTENNKNRFSRVNKYNVNTAAPKKANKNCVSGSGSITA